MDTRTLQAYGADASGYARQWCEQPAPDDMYALLTRYFRPGPTADIGCGAGRDVAWLATNGFDASGFDASESLLDEARRAYPSLSFELARLPELECVERGRYENVLCETVVMHLEPEVIGLAVQNLLALLKPGGTIFLSWRVTEQASQRDSAGRLYAAFDKQIVLDALAAGAVVLFDKDETSVSSGKRVQRMIVRVA
ncbi:class I SAM-dependent methyltransferase [Caballeronia humi]|uniref:Type 11 methyltransferase n=1 Tax=Caballeronia humi TaxID=326474 RepID=A0A158IW24_9BURK|nr:class I SAM-dependent methyltransferase [Caballeronia humi]SAL60872.1 type 11 methyltransferase [Caballeronia humi]